MTRFGREALIVLAALRAHVAGERVVILVPDEQRREALLRRYPELPPGIVQTSQERERSRPTKPQFECWDELSAHA